MDELATHLSAELAGLRARLLQGDFSDLEGQLARLSATEAALSTPGLGAGDASALRAEAARTQQVVSAAAAGMRAALRKLRETTDPTAAYTSDGRRVTLSSGQTGRGSRA